MKKFLALTIISLFAATTASAECPSLDALKEMTVTLAVQAKRGEAISKESLPQILECAEMFQNTDYKIAPQIIEVVSSLNDKGAY